MSQIKPENPTPEDEKRGYVVTIEDIGAKKVPMLHCIKCQFDVLAPEGEDPKQKQSGIFRMSNHIRKGSHPWGFEGLEEVTS